MKYNAVEIFGKHIQQVEADNAELRAEIERLRDDIKTQNKMLNEQVAIMADLNGEAIELEAQRQEDTDLIEAQKREIEVLHGIRDEAEKLREEVEQLQFVIRDIAEKHW